MRYITVPRDAQFKNRAKVDGKFISYTFKQWFAIDLASDPKWFSDADWEAAADSLWSATEAAGDDLVEGYVLELTDKAHEKVEVIVRAYPFGGDVKASFRWFVKAVTQADKLDPRKPAEPAVT